MAAFEAATAVRIFQTFYPFRISEHCLGFVSMSPFLSCEMLHPTFLVFIVTSSTMRQGRTRQRVPTTNRIPLSAVKRGVSKRQIIYIVQSD